MSDRPLFRRFNTAPLGPDRHRRNTFDARDFSRPAGKLGPITWIHKQGHIQGRREEKGKHTLSIPGGMGERRKFAVFGPKSLFPAPRGIQGGTKGTVHFGAEFHTLRANRTVRTVPHGALLQIGTDAAQIGEPV